MGVQRLLESGEHAPVFQKLGRRRLQQAEVEVVSVLVEEVDWRTDKEWEGA